MMIAKNPYVPIPMRIEKVTVETEDRSIKTFDLSFIHKEDEQVFRYLPGQFAQLSVFGKGEAPFGIASSPTRAGLLQFTVSRAGLLTSALHQMEHGDLVGIRGPLGSSFPLQEMEGRDLLVIGGGFAFTTLRSLVNYVLERDNRGRFGKLTVVYGARTPGMLLYKGELEQWQQRGDPKLHVTVDAADGDWKGRVGLVPDVVSDVAPAADGTYAVVCGPPAMTRYTLPVLERLHFPPERVVLSLEMKMKCGIGMCGRCNIGSSYVCKEGPVFTLAGLRRLPPEY
jgi:sulfhydrogenase subunit gamma (sulfur reductase)